MEKKMLEMAVNNAKNKLAAHREMGANSSLNILEVAHLMDVVTFGVDETYLESKTIFFSYNMN